MFEQFPAPKADAILALMSAYRNDPRTDKIDLGVGVYRDANGDTPVLDAVREAEQRVFQAQQTKAYVGIAGDAEFCQGMVDLTLADAVSADRVRCLQAPGGSGALRLLGELTNQAKRGARVFVSDPSWPNHIPLFEASGLTITAYRYFDPETRDVDFDGMLEGIADAGPGDVVLVHGCCHNPTGASLGLEHWQALAERASAQGFLPFVDFAYQGFGEGLEADAAGVRALAAAVPELLIATSCSKNFGLYRERVGAAILVAESSELADLAFKNAQSVARGNYSMPPDHGAAVVKTILTDASLRARWESELDTMRNRMLDTRRDLVAALRTATDSDRYDFVGRHSGMFSRLGIQGAQIDRMREEFGVYMVGDSRINVAGFRTGQVDAFAKALVATAA
ncbi:MAG: amino acid aminotransferase [Pseudomonadota bacterium]